MSALGQHTCFERIVNMTVVSVNQCDQLSISIKFKIWIARPELSGYGRWPKYWLNICSEGVAAGQGRVQEENSRGRGWSRLWAVRTRRAIVPSRSSALLPILPSALSTRAERRVERRPYRALCCCRYVVTDCYPFIIVRSCTPRFVYRIDRLLCDQP